MRLGTSTDVVEGVLPHEIHEVCLASVEGLDVCGHHLLDDFVGLFLVGSLPGNLYHWAARANVSGASAFSTQSMATEVPAEVVLFVCVLNFLELLVPLVVECVVLDEEDVAGEDVVPDVAGAGRCHAERIRVAGC